MKFDVFGTEIEVIRSDNAWQVFYVGGTGTKRPAGDLVIPSHIRESELQVYLADIRHEHASENYPEVKRIV